MGRILVCQHVAYEILGTLNPLIKEHGHRMRYVNFERDPDAQVSIDKYDGLIVLGGPMNVDQQGSYPHLTHEIALIQKTIAQNKPILGICLGAQLLAVALGATVTRNPVPEIGWYQLHLTDDGLADPIMEPFGEHEHMFQWHSYTFAIPDGAVPLARTSTCPNQAFRYGNNIYGFQFHMEVDRPMIERWLLVEEHQRELSTLQGVIDPEHIRQDTPQYIDRLKALSRDSFGTFLDLVGDRKTRTALPSR